MIEEVSSFKLAEEDDDIPDEEDENANGELGIAFASSSSLISISSGSCSETDVSTEVVFFESGAETLL